MNSPTSKSAGVERPNSAVKAFRSIRGWALRWLAPATVLFNTVLSLLNLRKVVSLCLTISLLAGCSQEKDKKESGEATSAKAPEAESRVKHGTNGEVIVTIESKLQPTIGLEFAKLEAQQLSPETKAYGHVLDPASLASMVADLLTAQAAGQASEAEFKRVKTLAAQNNASERALQSAQATAVHDQTQIQATRLKLMAGWGNAIAQRNDLPQFVQSLGSLDSALVQLELPAGEVLPGTPTAARVYALDTETNPVPAELIGPAPMVDPQMQGRGFLLLVSPNALKLVPGAAVTGLLSLPGEARSGVLLPRSTVVRFNGATWIYLVTGEETFQRTEVALDSPLPNGWFVAGGLKPGDKVVSVGGQALLSEELKGLGGGEE